MEVEIYKMTYKKYMDKKSLDFLFEYLDRESFHKYRHRTLILGKEFVQNNGNKGKLVIDNKKCVLKEFIRNKEIEKDKLKIGIVLSKDIYNKSYMFKNCYDLLKFFFVDYAFEYILRDYKGNDKSDDYCYKYVHILSPPLSVREHHYQQSDNKADHK